MIPFGVGSSLEGHLLAVQGGISIDVSRMNLGGLHTQGIDVGGSYVIPTATFGKFGVAMDGTYVRKYETQTDAGGAWSDAVGQPGALIVDRTPHRILIHGAPL